MKTKIGLVLLILFALMAQADADIFKAHEFRLDNGLRVIVLENHKAPIIKHMLWYNVGSADDGYGKGGRAHLLEHLMFRGTPSVPDGKYNELMMENGIESNAFTSHEMTVYHQLTDVRKLELVMALEADRMRHLNFDRKAFEAEQKIVFQERQQVVENNAASPFNERQNLLLWANSPYGHPVTGLNDEIMALTDEDIRHFYQKHYKPNNAVLILSGDIDAPTAKALSEKYYAQIPSSQSDHKVIAREAPQHTFQETLTMSLKNIQAAKIINKYLLPPSDLNDYYVWDVLVTYLGQGETSALYQDLVVQQKKMLTADMSYLRMNTGEAVVSLVMRPTDEENHDFKETSALIKSSLKKAAEDLTEQRLERVKRKILADLVYANDDPQNAAYMVGYMISSGFSLQDIQTYDKHINDVRLADVQKALQKLLSASVVEGVLLPLTEDKNG